MARTQRPEHITANSGKKNNYTNVTLFPTAYSKDHGTAQTVAGTKTSPVLHNLASGEDIAAQPVAWPICAIGSEGALTTPIKLFVAQCRGKKDTHHTTHTTNSTHHTTHNTT